MIIKSKLLVNNTIKTLVELNALTVGAASQMMVKWASDGLLQANDGKMLVNDCEICIRS